MKSGNKRALSLIEILLVLGLLVTALGWLGVASVQQWKNFQKSEAEGQWSQLVQQASLAVLIHGVDCTLTIRDKTLTATYEPIPLPETINVTDREVTIYAHGKTSPASH